MICQCARKLLVALVAVLAACVGATVARAQSGACCLPSGGCIVTPSQAACAWAFVGSGTTCSPAQCTSSIVGREIGFGGGASAGGGLTVSGIIITPVGGGTPGTSTLAGGSITLVSGLTVGGACPTGNCASGACCDPTGACTVITGSASCLPGFVYLGGGSTCSPGACSLTNLPPTGACCLVSACTLSFSTTCPPGAYRGNGTTCATQPCTGACCTPGSCTLIPNGTACAGTYLGDYSTCSPNTCPPSGACCTGGSCAIVWAADCTGPSYRGNNSTCSPTPCVGACCNSDGSCAVVVIGTCTGVYMGDYSACAVQDCAEVTAYQDFKDALRKTEIVRTKYALDPKPRVLAVLAGLRRIAARNPNISQAQLTQFASAYHGLLGSQFPGDPDLLIGFRLPTAVRFPNADIAGGLPGIDLEIGADVLYDLGVDPTGTHPKIPYLPRTQQMARFEISTVRSLSSSGEVTTVLKDLFLGKDANGGVPPGLVPAATSYLLTPGVGIDVNPSGATLAAEYPNVVAALALLPQTAAEYQTEAALGFPTLRFVVFNEIASVRQFINQKVGVVNSMGEVIQPGQLGQTLQQFPTVASSAQATQSALDAAVASYQADQLAIARSRSIMSMATEAMLRTAVDQQQINVQLKQYAAVQIQVADSSLSTALTAISGASQIAGDVASIVASKGANTGDGLASIVSGISTLLPLFGDLGPQVPSPEQQIMNEIANVRSQINAFQVQMNDRFNRVDALLIATYNGVLSGFDGINATLANQTLLIDSIKQNIAAISSDMSRFEQNLYATLTAGFNQDNIAAMNAALSYRKKFPLSPRDLDYGTSSSGFQFFQNTFYSFAADFAGQPLQSSTEPIAYTFADSSKTVFVPGGNALGFRLNGLRSVSGLVNLGSTSVPNPTAWSFSADAYAQLMRENPWYAALYAPAAVQPVRTPGLAAQAVMAKAMAPSLMNRLISDYETRRTTLLSRIQAAEAAFKTSAGVPALNLWGGTDQTVAQALPQLNNANDPYQIVSAWSNQTAFPPPGTRGRMFMVGMPSTTNQNQNFNRNFAGSGPISWWTGPQTSQDAPFRGAIFEYMPNFLPRAYYAAHYINTNAAAGYSALVPFRSLENYAFAMERFPAGATTWPMEFPQPGGDPPNRILAGAGGSISLFRSLSTPFPIARAGASRPSDANVMCVAERPNEKIMQVDYTFWVHTFNNCRDPGASANDDPFFVFSDYLTDHFIQCPLVGGRPNAIAEMFDLSESPELTWVDPNSTAPIPPGQKVWTRTPLVTLPGRDDAVRAEVNAALKKLQQDYLNLLTQALGGTVPAVNDANLTNALSGVVSAVQDLETTTRFLSAYLTLGAPLSVESIDTLRSAVRNGELRLDRQAWISAVQQWRGTSDSQLPRTEPLNFTGLPPMTCWPLVKSAIQALVARGTEQTPYFESYPFMEWTLASMDHLLRTFRTVAAEDQYLVSTGATLAIPASAGVLANDPPGPAPIDKIGVTQVLSWTQPNPGTGTVTMATDGSFTYTPPSAGFTGTATFTYVARALINGLTPGDPVPTTPSSWSISEPRTVRIVVDSCLPTITGQPMSAEFTAGSSRTFMVRANGPSRLTFQWQRNGVNVLDSLGACCRTEKNIATGATVGQACIVGPASSCTGTANGVTTTSARWIGGTTCLPSGCPTAPGTIISGTNTPVLTIRTMSEADRGNYTCVITSACGSVTSAAASLGSCGADIDNSGVVNIDDIFIFLNLWFAGCDGQGGPPCNGLSADVDNSGVVSIDDIFLFLNLWFAGCS